MPTYEYACRDCNKKFSRRESMAEHRPGRRVSCPKCKKQNVDRVYSSVYAVTARKS